MHSNTCQNCGEHVQANYCGQCGQKASTHRFSTRHIFEHDFIHGVFHVDKGLLYTTKQLLTRPGYAIREYVEGKRVNHFNYITLILLLIATEIFITTTTGFRYSAINPASIDTSFIDHLQMFMLTHAKEISMVKIPLLSLITYWVFRKAHQNYAEHLVMNAYLIAGNMIIDVFFIALSSIQTNKTVLLVLAALTPLASFIYMLTFYRQYFDKDYRNKLLLRFRAILAAQIIPMIAITIVMLTFLYFFDQKTLEHWIEAFIAKTPH